MAKRIALFAAWLGATALAVIVASAAVGTVRTEVTDQPAASEPFVATTAAGIATIASSSDPTTTVPEPRSTTTSVTVPTDNAPEQTTSTTVVVTTTTLAGSPTNEGDEGDDDHSESTTTVPEQTTTTAPSVTKTYNLAGGTITISASNPDVRLVGASPAAGYSIEVEDRGPSEVKVEFDSEDGESKFTATWDSGELEVDIEEE